MPSTPPICLLTSDCRVVGRAEGEPAVVRVHAVLDKLIEAEFRGSWLHAALVDRLLDCSENGGEWGEGGEHPLWTARAFEPLGASNSSTAELVFLMINSELIGRRQLRVPLSNCDGQIEQGGDLRFRWRVPRAAAPTPSLGRALRLVSSAAAIVVVSAEGAELLSGSELRTERSAQAPITQLLLHRCVAPSSAAGCAPGELAVSGFVAPPL